MINFCEFEAIHIHLLTFYNISISQLATMTIFCCFCSLCMQIFEFTKCNSWGLKDDSVGKVIQYSVGMAIQH